MIRINKNLAIFFSLTFLLGVSVLVFLQKFLPLVSYTVYYCQSFLNSLSMPIPYYLGAIPFLLFSVFLIIAATKLIVVYVKVQLFRKKLIATSKTNSSITYLLEKLQLIDNTYIVEDEKLFAFCLGIQHPKIYISTGLVGLLTSQESEAVLRHEQYHLNNKDTLTMLIASIGESLLPFFPLISDFLRNFRIEREIKADAQAIQGLGDSSPLISALKKLLVMPSVATVIAPAIADQETLEPRIKALVKKNFRFREFKLKNILISLASVLVMSAITLVPAQAVEVHHQGENVVMICPHDNDCLNACREEYSENRKNYSSENILYTPVQ